MPDDSDDGGVVLAKTCEYSCNGTEYTLVQGTAPEGYYCPEVLGGCNLQGETVKVEPVPIPLPE
jgi:hypothetical protein